MNIRIDPSLVVSWSTQLIEDEPFEYPFVARYKRGNKRLIYVASLHSSRSDSPSFKIIRHAFESKKIDYLLLEGIKHSEGKSPSRRVQWAKAQGTDGLYEGFETAFSVTLAHQNNIPFRGGEPDGLFVLSKVLDEGYRFEDLVFYDFTQQVFQLGQSQSTNEIEAERIFEDFIQRTNQDLGVGGALRFSDFLEWYRESNCSDFSVSEVHQEILAPLENGSLLTQRVSASVCKIRDRFILEKIGLALNVYDSVLVVFGGSHWSTQRISLEKALGQPALTQT